MNIKITTEQHEELCKQEYKEYLFGSRLHGIAHKNSDWDYIRVISDDFYNNFESLAIYFPNIHSFQYDGDNIQYVWMTEKQFYQNLFSGDGNMVADVVLLSGEFKNALKLCYTYKVIKGYLGVAKRDLKLHGDLPKKRFHALRSIYMAECLMEKHMPNITGIKNHHNLRYNNITNEYLKRREVALRDRLNKMLNEKKIELYPDFEEINDLVKTMLLANNTREFKYE